MLRMVTKSNRDINEKTARLYRSQPAVAGPGTVGPALLGPKVIFRRHGPARAAIVATDRELVRLDLHRNGPPAVDRVRADEDWSTVILSTVIWSTG
jgi:hypothetical protein